MRWHKDNKLTEMAVAERGCNNKSRIDSTVAKAMTYLTDPNKSKRLVETLNEIPKQAS